MVIWVKLAGALWIIGGEIRQLINILFCGYQRRSEIRHLTSSTRAETYTRQGTGAPVSYSYSGCKSFLTLEFNVATKFILYTFLTEQ
jgi:hypothetical protein